MIFFWPYAGRVDGCSFCVHHLIFSVTPFRFVLPKGGWRGLGPPSISRSMMTPFGTESFFYSTSFLGTCFNAFCPRPLLDFWLGISIVHLLPNVVRCPLVVFAWIYTIYGGFLSTLPLCCSPAYCFR